MKILVVEDDADMRDIIVSSLRREHYAAETAETLAEARRRVADYVYDCVLLDVMLPDGSGLDVLAYMQRTAPERRMPVIILSARDALEDKVEGLELGADDYLPKPFHLAELHARLRSVLRRHRGGRCLSCGNLTLCPERLSAEVEGRPLELGRKEYDILLYFMSRLGRLVEKQTLAEAVWGEEADQAYNFDFIYAQIKNLRRRLSQAGATVELKTVYGFGYKLVES